MKTIYLEEYPKDPDKTIATIIKKLRKQTDPTEAKDLFSKLAVDEQILSSLLIESGLDPAAAPDQFANDLVLLANACAFLAQEAPEPIYTLENQVLREKPSVSKGDTLKLDSAYDAIIDYKETFAAIKSPNIMPVQTRALKQVFQKKTIETLDQLFEKPSKLSRKQIETIDKLTDSTFLQSSSPTYILDIQNQFKTDQMEKINKQEVEQMTGKSQDKLISREQTDAQRIAGRK